MWDNKVRSALAQSFLAALKEDQLPWRKCWSTGVSFSTGKPYRGINNLILSYAAETNGYKDPRWLTFHQARSRGWHVRKGEKATQIEHWQYYDAKLKKNVEREEVLRIQKQEPERMKDIRLAAYTHSVFNAEQIEGIPPYEATRKTVDIARLKAQRDILLTNMGVGFREGGGRAYYSPSSDTITLPHVEAFSGDYSYAATLLHEAGHATGHSSRLDWSMEGAFGSPEYAKEELRAEIASAFVAQALQLPRQEAAEELDNHKAYIQSWISILENDPNELFAAIKDADKIADYLIERGHLEELVQGQEPQAAEPVEQDYVKKQGEDVAVARSPLEILDELDAFRRKYHNNAQHPSDWCMRVMEAIVAEAFGYKDRNSWTDALSADTSSKYYQYLHDLEPEEVEEEEL